MTVLAIDTPWGEARLPALTRELPGGRVGYYMRRQDDCLRAALATATQIAYEDVPDFRDGPHLAAWLAGHRLRMTVHRAAPPTWAPLWIGETGRLSGGASHGGGEGKRHTVVCRYERIIFDPWLGWQPPPELTLRITRPSDLEGGLILHPTDEGNRP